MGPVSSPARALWTLPVLVPAFGGFLLLVALLAPSVRAWEKGVGEEGEGLGGDGVAPSLASAPSSHRPWG